MQAISHAVGQSLDRSLLVGPRPLTSSHTGWNRRLWIAWLVTPCTLILAVSVVYFLLPANIFMHNSYWYVQKPLFLDINYEASLLPDPLWWNLTQIGNALIIFPLLSFLIPLRPQAWAAMVGSVFVAASCSVIGKNLAAMPRPGAVLDITAFHPIGKLLTGHSSLPSGHSITVFAGTIAVLATVMPMPKGFRQWTYLTAILVVAAILCLSRVAVGAHWPLDTVAGAGIGWIGGLSGAALARRWQQWWLGALEGKARIVLGSVLFMWAAYLLEMSVRDAASAPAPVFCLAAVIAFATSFWLLIRRVILYIPLLNK